MGDYAQDSIDRDFSMESWEEEHPEDCEEDPLSSYSHPSTNKAMSEKIIDVEPVKDEPKQNQALQVRETGGAVGPALPPEDIKPQITAAQAKVNAIADLTMSAYQKAATLQITAEEVAKLSADFPDEAFKPGAAGKENLIYIEHAYLRGRLNEVFGMGQWALIPRNRWAEDFTLPARYDKPAVSGTKVYVEAMLVVRGCFVGEAVGSMDYYPHNHQQDYADAVEGAKTAAFRRCAKEFGIGLQAWKKDWCEGWWERKRSHGNVKASYSRPASQNAPGSTGAATPPMIGGTPFRKQEPPKAKESAHTEGFATDAYRAKMIATLQAGPGQPSRAIVTEYFQKIDQLMPNEEVEDLPLRFVPANKEQMLALTGKLSEFGNGLEASRAFPPNDEPAKPKGSAKAKLVEVPRDPPGEPPTEEEKDLWFMQVIAPVPRKGMKRDEYLKNPDTIGSLWAQRHGTDDEAAAARQRLFGFVSYFEPKGWTKKDGTEMPPSKADIDFKKALDAFAEWFEQEHPDEKL